MSNVNRYVLQMSNGGNSVNVLGFEPSKLDDVKAACETLIAACDHSMQFYVVDTSTGACQKIIKYPRSNEPHGWHVPNNAVQNPVQAGLDRTTSGAIGQP